ncbi:MAG: ribonuclease E inhibitor RraB [Proteobacteria bacterium]|nr:ribonuclease E inhibitor RraB [Pseudomonadota bacterium]
MERDYALYPEDDNGNVLWKMKQGGDNLDIPREVDFAVIFADEPSALEFAMRLLRYGQKVSFGRYEGERGSFPRCRRIPSWWRATSTSMATSASSARTLPRSAVE